MNYALRYQSDGYFYLIEGEPDSWSRDIQNATLLSRLRAQDLKSFYKLHGPYTPSLIYELIPEIEVIVARIMKS